MYLFFPQWQGSGPTDEVYHGARLLRESLPTKLDFVDVPVTPLHAVALEDNIWGYPALVDQLQAACSILKGHNPDAIFAIGGDCAGEIAPVSFLNQHYQGDLAVIWMDAHADMNTPASSPSKTLHGMPLRTLLGEGDSQMVKSMFSPLSPRQVFLVGTREFDPDEERYIQRHQVKGYSPSDLARNPQNLMDQIEDAGFHNLYIHLDLDVLDPAVFPYTNFPSPDGLTVPQLMTVLEMLCDHFHVTGFSLLELAPREHTSLTGIAPILDLFTHLSES